MTEISPGGNLSRRLDGRDVAGLVERVDLLLERLADAVDLGHPALARQRGDRHGGLAHGLGRRAVGDHAVGDGAVELVEVAELVEGGGDLGVGEVGHAGPLAYGAARARPRLAHPPHLRRGREPRARGRGRPRRAAARGPAHPRRRRRLARRHRRARRAARRRRCCTARASSGLGSAYVAGFAHALAGGAELVCQMDADGSHDPAGAARACSRSRAAAPTSRSARATCPAAAWSAGTRRGARSRAPAASTRAPSCACPCAT